MNSKVSKKTKVIIAGINPEKKNTAAYNRFLGTVKILRSLYECQIVMPDRLKNKSRVLTGLVARCHLLKAIVPILINLDNKNYNHVVFLKYTDPVLCFFIWLLAKGKDVKLAIERNEFPAVLISEKPRLIKLIWYKYFVLSWHYRLIDVLFLMTDELIDFYSRYARKDCIIQKFPMTVDFSRFKSRSINACSEKSYIFYAGSLSERKDGVESLIQAFAKISKKFPDLYLKLAGGANDGKQETKLNNLIKTMSLEDRVILLGIVERNKIPEYLCNAKIVVLPRPATKQAQGGFPTKLGEYLAAGRPVIVTRVGEISRYLSEEDIFFISPDHIVEELSVKIENILLDYDNAHVVAEKGKNAAKKYFSLEANQEIFKRAFERLFS